MTLLEEFWVSQNPAECADTPPWLTAFNANIEKNSSYSKFPKATACAPVFPPPPGQAKPPAAARPPANATAPPPPLAAPPPVVVEERSSGPSITIIAAAAAGVVLLLLVAVLAVVLVRNKRRKQAELQRAEDAAGSMEDGTKVMWAAAPHSYAPSFVTSMPGSDVGSPTAAQAAAAPPPNLVPIRIGEVTSPPASNAGVN